MASRKTIDELIENINEDIEKASTKEINKIYEELKKILKKYDGDDSWDIFDYPY